MRDAVRACLIAILFAIGGSVLAGCWSGGDNSARQNSGRSINVAIVDNPQAQDLARLTPSFFTAQRISWVRRSREPGVPRVRPRPHRVLAMPAVLVIRTGLYGRVSRTVLASVR